MNSALTWSELLPWLSLGSALHLVLFLVVLVNLLGNRREPTSALLWMFVVWSFPFVGALVFWLFGINRISKRADRKEWADQRLQRERVYRENGTDLAYWRAVHQSLATEPHTDFARELNRAMNHRLRDYPLLDGNRLQPLIGGDEAFPAMLQAIDQARDHIHVQTFIIGNDRVGREFMDRLAKRATEGVTVRVIYDALGSTFAVFSGLFRRYRNIPNMEICGWTHARPLRAQFHINLRNHRKLLLIDGRRAFIGGINLQAAHTTRRRRKAIRDYHFAVHGPIVQELQYAFLRDWHFMTDAEPDTLLSTSLFPEIARAGKALVRLINSGPTPSENETVADVFFSAISAARRQIIIVTPYFIPPLFLSRALQSAAQRGVETRLIVPRKNNHPLAAWAGRALYDDLMDSGVRIHERRPPFMHAKAMVIDDTVALIGSANLDARSLRLSYETNLAVYDEKLIGKLKEIIWEDIAHSDELDLHRWRQRPRRNRFLENFCHLFAPML